MFSINYNLTTQNATTATTPSILARFDLTLRFGGRMLSLLHSLYFLQRRIPRRRSGYLLYCRQEDETVAFPKQFEMQQTSCSHVRPLPHYYFSSSWAHSLLPFISIILTPWHIHIFLQSLSSKPTVMTLVSDSAVPSVDVNWLGWAMIQSARAALTVRL